MPLVGVIIETPSLVPVGLPIVTIVQYEVNRELNAAGSWACAFPASEQLAAQIKSRWRVSLIEQGRTSYLLHRGIILDHTYRIAEDGTAIVALQGMTALYALMNTSTHLGLEFDGTVSIDDIALELTGDVVTAPDDAVNRKPKVTYNDVSKLEALLHADEMARYNIRETFEIDDDNPFELVSQDDVPDSGFRFVNVETVGPELENAAAEGMGLIAGAPTLGYSGKDLANRIIPVGVEHDGTPLYLNESNRTLPYAIQTGVNPDASEYYYLEDADSVDTYDLVELQYVRSDVKNPSDDAGTRLASANVLYDLAAGELLKRKSEVISFGSNIANGYAIDALPGSRVRVQFRGTVRLLNGRFTWKDVDQDFLIVKRRDSSTVAGVREVSFTVTAPDVPLINLDLPDAVPIPPPPSPPQDPPNPPDPNGGDGGKKDKEEDPVPDAPPGDPGLEVPTDTGPQDLAKILKGDQGIGVPYQPCCAGPIDAKDHSTPPPTNGNSHWVDVTPLNSVGITFTSDEVVVGILFADTVGGAETVSTDVTGLTDATAELIASWTAQISSAPDEFTRYKVYLVKPTGASPGWVQDFNSFGVAGFVGGRYGSNAGIAGVSVAVTHDQDYTFGTGTLNASVSSTRTSNHAGSLVTRRYNGTLVDENGIDGTAIGPGGGENHVTVDNGGDPTPTKYFVHATAVKVNLP